MDTQTSNLVFSVFCLSMCVCHKMHLTMRVKSLKDQDPSTQQPPKTQKEFIPFSCCPGLRLLLSWPMHPS